MTASLHTRFLGAAAAATVVALSAVPLTQSAEPALPRVSVPSVDLAAAPLGAIPAGFLRNQATFCSLICPSVVQLAVTVPAGAAAAPVVFAQSLQQTGNVARAIGAATASVTKPATAATERIIGNDLSLVLPKAQNTLQVAVVAAVDVITGATSLNNARNRILEALDQPTGVPTVATGAHGVLEVALVESINVVSAVAFQAGETLLLGVVQTANAAATALADTGDLRAALKAGAQQAHSVAETARGQVTSALHTAATNITAALHDSALSTKAAPTAASGTSSPDFTGATADLTASPTVKAQRQVRHRGEARSSGAHRGNGVRSLHRGRAG